MKKATIFILIFFTLLRLNAQVTGSGTLNKIPVFTGASQIADSDLSQGFFSGRNTMAIGTTPNAYKLIVNDNIEGASTVVLNNDASGGGFAVTKGATWLGFMGSADTWTGGGSTNDFAVSAYTGGIRFFTANSGVVKMVLNSSGNLGVGTTNPISKLSVKGSVESEEIQVKSNVADYVFSENYKVMSIDEIEKYIKDNGVLPRIQTQKDVDENRGLVKIGELSVSLMEKVEELTLHIIDLNKRIRKLENQLKN